MEKFADIKSKINSFNYVDYLRTLKVINDEFDLTNHKPLRIAVLRSYSAEMIEPILKLKLILNGYNPVFFWGDYNQYTQEILDEDSLLYGFKPDLVLLLVRVEELMPSLVWQFAEKKPVEWTEDVNKTAAYFLRLISSLNERITVDPSV